MLIAKICEFCNKGITINELDNIIGSCIVVAKRWMVKFAGEFLKYSTFFGKISHVKLDHEESLEEESLVFNLIDKPNAPPLVTPPSSCNKRKRFTN